MDQFNSKNYPIYANFLNKLAKDLTSFYYSKLNKTFKVSNKLKGKGYDPVTTSDKAFEKFIRSKIKNKFPDHQIVGEEFGHKKTNSDFTWVIDPIDGTRSFVIGNPTWSNLISLNYKGNPILGLANFPVLKKYYINHSDKAAYVVDNGKRKKITVNKKVSFKDVKVSAAFHGWLSLDRQKKIPKILKLIALLWCVFVVLCLLIPGQALDGFNFEYVHAISLFIFLIIGYIVYINKKK